MALVQRDYILRMIERIAAAIARVMKRKSDGDLVGARQELQQATMELLGPASAMALMVDSRTAANLVGDAKRIQLWCRLLAEDREVLQSMGREAEARNADRRIVELLLEAWKREKEWDDETRAVFAAARARGGDDAIDPGFRAALEAWEGEQR